MLLTEAMFVVQVKRIYEYKRQLLACLQIVFHYLALKRDPEALQSRGRGHLRGQGRARLLHGEAAHPPAQRRRGSGHLADPAVRGRLSMAFVPNYGVTLAQTIIPSADVSLQISTAGKEASGTSNMKFALNGALTLGTLDGANVEIRDAVGHDNFFLFGMDTPQVAALRASGYRPGDFIAASPGLQQALELIESGFFSLGDRDRYKPILDNLKWDDLFMVC